MNDWRSELFDPAPNDPLLRGYPVADMVPSTSFVSVIHLALKGELPSETQHGLLRATLVANVDEGPTAPSALVARQSATARAPILSSLAAGLMAMGSVHLGSVAPCLKMLHDIVVRVLDGQGSMERIADEVAVDFHAMGRSIPGFGHRLHPRDRRAAALRSLALGSEIPGEHLEALAALEGAIERIRGSRLEANLLGVTAAVLGELGYSPDEATMALALARLPGLAGHVLEERRSFRPGRKVAEVPVSYHGPARRPLPVPVMDGDKGYTEDAEACCRPGPGTSPLEFGEG